MRYAFNSCSEKALRDMPQSMSSTIKSVQDGIESTVLRYFPSAKPLSGFRCTCENTRCGGVAHSLHLVGCARDYVLCDGFPSSLPGLRVIFERAKNVVHVEVI